MQGAVSLLSPIRLPRRPPIPERERSTYIVQQEALLLARRVAFLPNDPAGSDMSSRSPTSGILEAYLCAGYLSLIAFMMSSSACRSAFVTRSCGARTGQEGGQSIE